MPMRVTPNTMSEASARGKKIQCFYSLNVLFTAMIFRLSYSCPHAGSLITNNFSSQDGVSNLVERNGENKSKTNDHYILMT